MKYNTWQLQTRLKEDENEFNYIFGLTYSGTLSYVNGGILISDYWKKLL